MITLRLVALALGLAVAASTSFAQVRTPLPAPSAAPQGSKPLPEPSDARAQAIHDCNIEAGRFIDHVWGDWEIYVYRACMARHGQPE
jgi:hypothetical protein